MSIRVKLEDLIEAGIIEPGFPIHAKFKGRNFSAVIDRDGFVLFEGKRRTSLSVAGGIVRAMVSGKPDDGLPYRRVNGWTFWRYTDVKGEIRRMDELRKRFEATAHDGCPAGLRKEEFAGPGHMGDKSHCKKPSLGF